LKIEELSNQQRISRNINIEVSNFEGYLRSISKQIVLGYLQAKLELTCRELEDEEEDAMKDYVRLEIL